MLLGHCQDPSAEEPVNITAADISMLEHSIDPWIRTAGTDLLYPPGGHPISTFAHIAGWFAGEPNGDCCLC